MQLARSNIKERINNSIHILYYKLICQHPSEINTDIALHVAASAASAQGTTAAAVVWLKSLQSN